MYSQFEGAKRTRHYAAFLLSAGQPIRRIELGPATEIDRTITVWRNSIERGADREAARDVAKKVWEPLARFIPAGTRTLYLSPDGDLARLPWSALPGTTPGSVLLEAFPEGIAVIPHGPALLDALRTKASDRPLKNIVTIGDLDYSGSAWTILSGTKRELAAIVAVAPVEPTTLMGTAATVAKLRSLLPQAQVVHLATHGYFAAEELASERRRDLELLRRWSEGSSSHRSAMAKNPLGFVGLVLSKGEILSGLSILDLDISHLHLITLSACETGLGELTAGEGVQGLQRAFHLAGCPNVVASLWKVNDAATAALMAKFYHELWINKKPPIESLREAQLMILRRPDLIPDLAGERGAPNLKKAIEVKSVDPVPRDVISKKTAATKLWAAFVLSGMGK